MFSARGDVGAGQPAQEVQARTKVNADPTRQVKGNAGEGEESTDHAKPTQEVQAQAMDNTRFHAPGVDSGHAQWPIIKALVWGA